MSAPEESRDRRRGLAMPKSLRGSGAVVGGFALGMLSISTGVGAVVLTGLVISGWLSIEWLSLAAGLLGTCVVSFAVHRRMNERIALAADFVIHLHAVDLDRRANGFGLGKGGGGHEQGAGDDGGAKHGSSPQDGCPASRPGF